MQLRICLLYTSEQGLREALLCLQAQECQDFEILLIAHKADEEHGKLIEEILEDQEEEFRKKIRFFRLNEGTRTTPLNYGFSHAWGKYACLLYTSITVLIYWFIFQIGFKNGDVDGYPFILWLVSGLLPWFFVSDSITNATSILVEDSYLV